VRCFLPGAFVWAWSEVFSAGGVCLSLEWGLISQRGLFGLGVGCFLPGAFVWAWSGVFSARGVCLSLE